MSVRQNDLTGAMSASETNLLFFEEVRRVRRVEHLRMNGNFR